MLEHNTFLTKDFNILRLKNAKGATIKDEFILFSLEYSYLALRFFGRLFLGRKRRYDLFARAGIVNFKNYLPKCSKLLGENYLLLKVYVPKHDFHVYCRSENGFIDFTLMTGHEDDLIEQFRPKEGDIVVDIGAHIGLYTIIGSKCVGGKGKVVAIDADPNNFEMLNRNIKLNKLTNVLALNHIVYSKEMELELVDYGRMLGFDGKTKNMTLAAHGGTPGQTDTPVQANTLDNLLQRNGIKEVNWMKIDVEGAEYEVLKGARNILSNSKNISILIEIHGTSHLYKPIIDLLNSYNFRIIFEKSFPDYKRLNMGGAKNMVLRKF
jgi:FkbM family methyltransferase